MKKRGKKKDKLNEKRKITEDEVYKWLVENK